MNELIFFDGKFTELTERDKEIYNVGWQYYFDDSIPFLPKTPFQLKLFMQGYTEAITTEDNRDYHEFS